MDAGAGPRRAFAACRRWTAAYLANDDPLAEAANGGAFLVWSSQPLYPLYVWLLVGPAAWPALLTWLSTPAFAAVPIVARRRPLAGRLLFVGAGLANTLLATKAFGGAWAVGWFLVPCLAIGVAFFRRTEWRAAFGSIVAAAGAAALLPHLQPPLVAYDAVQIASLRRLNLWSVVVLTLYLLFSAWRARRGTSSAGRAHDQA